MLAALPDPVTLVLSILAASYASIWLTVMVTVLLDRARRRLSNLRP